MWQFGKLFVCVQGEGCWYGLGMRGASPHVESGWAAQWWLSAGIEWGRQVASVYFIMNFFWLAWVGDEWGFSLCGGQCERSGGLARAVSTWGRQVASGQWRRRQSKQSRRLGRSLLSLPPPFSPPPGHLSGGSLSVKGEKPSEWVSEVKWGCHPNWGSGVASWWHNYPTTCPAESSEIAPHSTCSMALPQSTAGGWVCPSENCESPSYLSPRPWAEWRCQQLSVYVSESGSNPTMATVTARTPLKDSDGLILPKKLLNPCLESRSVKDLHREIKWNKKA